MFTWSARVHKGKCERLKLKQKQKDLHVTTNTFQVASIIIVFVCRVIVLRMLIRCCITQIQYVNALQTKPALMCAHGM